MTKHRLNNPLFLIFVWMGAVITPFILIGRSAHYFFNFYAFGTVLTSYFVGALGIIIASKGLEQKERQQLLLLSMCFFVWLWAVGIAGLCKFGESRLAAIWCRAANVGVVFIAAQFYSFTVTFLKLSRKKLVVAGYAIGAIFAILNIFTPYLVSNVQWFKWGYYAHWQLIRTIPFMAYFSLGLGLSLFESITAYRKSKSEHLRNQLKYIIAAFAMSYLGSIDYLNAYGYNVYPCGYMAIFGWWTILAYAILKHRLMDITVIIRRTLIYSCVIISLVGIYLAVIALLTRIFQGLTGNATVFPSALAAGLVTLSFQPLRKRVQSFVDAKFFRQYVDREEKLYELSREVVTHSTPEAMAQALVNVLQETLHPKSGVLYLKSKDGGSFVPTASWGGQEREAIAVNNPLPSYFLDHTQPFVQEMTDNMGAPLDTRARANKSRNAA